VEEEDTDYVFDYDEGCDEYEDMMEEEYNYDDDGCDEYENMIEEENNYDDDGDKGKKEQKVVLKKVPLQELYEIGDKNKWTKKLIEEYL